MDLYIPSATWTLGIKICAWWVPKQFTDEHKQKHVHAIFAIILWRRGFLQCIVTGNETWVHHYEPENTHHCPRQRFKTVPSAGKVMFTLFWNFQQAHPQALPGAWTNGQQCTCYT
jgi:hypothetical protein